MYKSRGPDSRQALAPFAEAPGWLLESRAGTGRVIPLTGIGSRHTFTAQALGRLSPASCGPTDQPALGSLTSLRSLQADSRQGLPLRPDRPLSPGLSPPRPLTPMVAVAGSLAESANARIAKVRAL